MRIVSKPARKVRIREDGGRGSLPNAGQYESLLERDYYTLLKIDPRVESFQPQPIVVPYRDSRGRNRKYFPDVLVHYRCTEEGRPPSSLVEVKPREKLEQASASLTCKLEAGRQFAAANGWSFMVATEREIRVPRLENAKFLAMYLRREPTPMTRERLLLVLGELVSADVQTLLAALCKDKWNQAEQIPHIWYLVAKGEITVDLSAPLTMGSLLSLPEREE